MGCSSKSHEAGTGTQQGVLAGTESVDQANPPTQPLVAESQGDTQNESPSSTGTLPDEKDAMLANELFAASDSVSADGQDVSNDSKLTPLTSAMSNAKQLQLRSNLQPSQLTEFLKLADLEMQNIVSGRAGVHDQREAIAELVRVGKMKLQASEQLAASSEATEAEKSLGRRGQLQALSHLAAHGDLPSAERLEKLATEWIQSGIQQSKMILAWC